jgi:hypothetical protein
MVDMEEKKKKKKNRQKEASCQIGEKEKDTKRQSALWRIGRKRMEQNWSFLQSRSCFALENLIQLKKIGCLVIILF